ncbi:hypothetical protein E2C01_008176 [Portunus trituberculatus]|uniref:Uncharacterized protein n=1 Tax=Portunus trituberculatus TaxID=210409 RepID=A0A5B7D443_PORTR|nr:hypothetical protein [Portunus trituberculatus]
MFIGLNWTEPHSHKGRNWTPDPTSSKQLAECKREKIRPDHRPHQQCDPTRAAHQYMSGSGGINFVH